MSASDQPLIRLDGVTKVFLTDEVETHALAGIHMELKKGEYISIAGPSGCGKSTLLSILGLLDSPTDGNYLLAGKPRDRQERRQCGKEGDVSDHWPALLRRPDPRGSTKSGDRVD